MKKIIGFITFSVMCLTLLLFNFGHTQPANAQGSCTIGGKQLTTADGTLVCDCTATGATNCNCMVRCSGGAEELELIQN